jgi:hypothetical protein
MHSNKLQQLNIKYKTIQLICTRTILQQQTVILKSNNYRACID